MNTILITPDMVKATEAYKKMTPIAKKLATSRNNVKCAIQYGVNLVSNIGEKKWEQITNTSFHNKKIVLEIVKSIEEKK